MRKASRPFVASKVKGDLEQNASGERVGHTARALLADFSARARVRLLGRAQWLYFI
jgi:hypothetical protein